MNNPKKSFILHLDSLCVLDEMTLEQKGILFDAIYNFQLGVEVELDFSMKMAFAPFKNQFIRDNEKYLQFIEKQSNNGKKGGRPTESQDNPNNPSLSEEPKPTLNDKVSVKVSASKKDSIINDFDFKNKLFELVQDEQIVNDFLIVRKNKKSSNTETAFNGLIKKITQANISVKDAIKICVEKSWAGFDGEWLAKSGITVPSSSNEKQIEFYEGKQIYESNGRRYILKGESVKYIYPKEPNMEGWTEREIYNYRTCDRFNDTWAEKYKNARDNQMNTTEAEKRGIYKYFYDQETLRFKIADHRNVRTS